MEGIIRNSRNTIVKSDSLESGFPSWFNEGLLWPDTFTYTGESGTLFRDPNPDPAFVAL
jgi:hypothetical protein